jgi:hypothetical protein
MKHRDKLNRASEYLADLLKAKRCALWPDCGCKAQLVEWQSQLRTKKDWDFESLRWAEISIFITLTCVANWCPVRRYRTYAQIQLLNPWWDRQRRGEELTEEFVEQLGERKQ